MAYQRSRLTFFAAGNGQYLGLYREANTLAKIIADNYFNNAAAELKRKGYPPIVIAASDKTDIREPYLDGSNIKVRGTGS